MENQNPVSSSPPPPPPPPPWPPNEEPESKRLKTSPTTATTDKKPRYKRRKIAILFAYCGVGYQGMQKNPGAKTIEGDLEQALYFSSAVPENERGCPNRYDFARSARTDKGVSAVGQVVSGKFYVDPPGLVNRLNSNLPSQFRVFGYKRVTASFSAKKFCDKRRYVYLLPVFALDPGCHCGVAKCLVCEERGWKVFEVQSDITSNSSCALVGFDGKVENLASLGDGIGSKVNSLEDLSDLGKKCEDNSSFEVEIQPDITSNSSCALVDVDGKVENLASLGDGNGFNVNSLEDSSDLGKSCGKVSNSEAEIQPDITSNSSCALLDSDGKVGNIGDLDNGDGFKVKSVEDSSDLVKNGDNNSGSDGVNGGIVKQNVFSYDEDKRQRFNKILKQYEGTHNFHNFTTRVKAADPSANRYIISFHANATVAVDGMEFVKCEVIGQSFMLHQIRKMIGCAVAIMRNCAPESLIETALKQDVRITLPTAPEVGLYLDECFFSSYNQKWRDTHEEVSMKAYADEAEEFKLKHIYSHIAATERKEGAVAVWLHSLNRRSYPDLAPPEENGGANEVPRTQPE